MKMEDFFVKAGELLLVIQTVAGTAPTRTFGVRFVYERGEAEFDGRTWVEMRLYSETEQTQIDAARRALN